jgi:tetratricopeptide (TPR) repeat protein
MQKGRMGKPEKRFYEAVQFFQAGNFADAEKICRKVLTRRPNHGDTLNLIGLVRARGGDFKTAIEFLRRATKSNELNVGYHFTLGEVLAATGDLGGAKVSFKQALSLEPDNLACLMNLGMANIYSKHWAQAVNAFTRAVCVAPKEAKIYARLGIALQESNEISGAIDAYQTSIQLGINDSHTYFNLGTALTRIDDIDGAIKAYQMVLKLEPNYQAAYRNLGGVFLKLAEYKDAVTMLRSAVEMAPDDLVSLQDLGSALLGTLEYEEAVRVSEKALELDLNSISRWSDLAFAHLCAGNPDRALTASDQGLLIKANDTSCLAFKATALNHLERRKEAGFLLGFDRLIFQKQFSEIEGYASNDDFNEALYDHVKNHSSLNISKLNRGLVMGQGTLELFDGELSPVLVTFQKIIESTIEDYKEAVPIDKNHPFLMRQPRKIKIQCWATIIKSGGFLDTHFHPPGWLSGVYYPRLPNAVDHHSESHEGWIEFGKEYYRIGSKDQPPVFLVKPSLGLMVLFPSYMGHRTLAFESTEERMSVSFDILPIS